MLGFSVRSENARYAAAASLRNPSCAERALAEDEAERRRQKRVTMAAAHAASGVKIQRERNESARRAHHDAHR